MWRIKHVGALLLLTGLYWSCSSAHKSAMLQRAEIVHRPRVPSKATLTLGNPTDYLPDPNRPEMQPRRTIRVNVHFMNSADGTNNYDAEEALPFAKALVDGANKHLADNQKMWLPLENETDVLPPNYRLKLTSSVGHDDAQGVYCHHDDELFYFVSRGKNRNNYSRPVIQKYGVGLDSILNIFVMPHHPDSIKSRSYDVTTAGIALGSAVKLSGIYETGKQAYSFRGLLNHEIGHVLGLRHTWSGNDGCDDTPNHMNCWNKTKGIPCDTKASNNLMDYNAKQHAWTPCQIGKIHAGLGRENSKGRNLLIKDWCRPKPDHDVIVFGTEVWSGAKDLAGDVVVKSGGKLTINNRVSLPAGGKILVEAGGQLILGSVKLHNACGLDWQGIMVAGKNSQKGSVTFEGEPTFENVNSAFLAGLQK